MRYTKHGETISVKINDNYSVFAMARWDKEDRQYKVTLYLRNESIGNLSLLLNAVDVPIQAKRNTLYSEVTKYIESLMTDRFFLKAITAYEFELECFDKGIELFDELTYTDRNDVR